MHKLGLQPGMRVVEAGCGWGALALHMAERYGVRLRAFNISKAQIDDARSAAAQSGLGDRLEFVHDDYRNIDGTCDAFVSIGMQGHVGQDNCRTLGDAIHRILEPGGLRLILTAGRSTPMPPSARLERRIFRGSHLPSLREIMRVFEPRQFFVLDIENLRLRYPQTLAAWLRRFDSQVEGIRRMYGRFVRAWQLYLGGCAAVFRTSSSTQLYQVVFAHPEHTTIPITRARKRGRERAATAGIVELPWA